VSLRALAKPDLAAASLELVVDPTKKVDELLVDARLHTTRSRVVLVVPARDESRKGEHIKRVGLVFAGGPAPAANAVISSAAISFLEDNREVIGFFHGYSNLELYHPVSHRLLPDEHYRIFELKDLSRLRNTLGIVIGTARSMLGSQLGIGAYRALVEENLDGYMVSVSGQLDLNYVPFKDLINPQNLKTEVRYIRPGSDYHKLARFLETRTDKIVEWAPGRREEH